MRRARADLEVERLLQQAAVRGPELREREDEILESQRWSAADREVFVSVGSGGTRRISRSARSDLSLALEVSRHQQAVQRLELDEHVRGHPAPSSRGPPLYARRPEMSARPATTASRTDLRPGLPRSGRKSARRQTAPATRRRPAGR